MEFKLIFLIFDECICKPQEIRNLKIVNDVTNLN